MRIADVWPLTPLQEGLLFHASAGRASDDVYAVQLVVTVTGRLDADRLRDAVHAVVGRHPNLAATTSVTACLPRSVTSFTACALVSSVTFGYSRAG